MPKGMSVHIGLNHVDPSHYQDAYGNPWEGTLVACEADAGDMQAIAQSRGFGTQVLLTDQATAQNVIGAISKAAEELQTGDIFFISYSGHGGQVPDRNGEFQDEEDEMDETWCLFDRQLIDDELYGLWSKFRQGVRIFMLSDSCHSGSVAKDPDVQQTAAGRGARMRVAPSEVQAGTYNAHREAYDQIQAKNPAADQAEVKASVILISGCQDSQVSYDGDANGLFTGTLLKVWDNGRFKGNILRFGTRIVAAMPHYQVPNLFKTGAPSRPFERQRPFTI